MPACAAVYSGALQTHVTTAFDNGSKMKQRDEPWNLLTSMRMHWRHLYGKQESNELVEHCVGHVPSLQGKRREPNDSAREQHNDQSLILHVRLSSGCGNKRSQEQTLQRAVSTSSNSTAGEFSQPTKPRAKQKRLPTRKRSSSSTRDNHVSESSLAASNQTVLISEALPATGSQASHLVVQPFFTNKARRPMSDSLVRASNGALQLDQPRKRFRKQRPTNQDIPKPENNLNGTEVLVQLAQSVPWGRSSIMPCPQEPSAAHMLECRSGCARSECWTGRNLLAHHKPPPLVHTRMSAKDVAPVGGKLSTAAVKYTPGLELFNPKNRIQKIANLHAAFKASKLKMYRFIIRRSCIAELGVYTTANIAAGELLMEYTGEIIRRTVGDQREKAYNKRGLGCYLFSLGNEWVVDATDRGNIARFINHSCDPNCVARLAPVAGRCRIFILSSREIVAGEELSYDYCMSDQPITKEGGAVDGAGTIGCNCGSKQCRGHL